MRDEGLVALHANPGHSWGKTTSVTQVPKTTAFLCPSGIILENPWSRSAFSFYRRKWRLRQGKMAGPVSCWLRRGSRSPDSQWFHIPSSITSYPDSASKCTASPFSIVTSIATKFLNRCSSLLVRLISSVSDFLSLLSKWRKFWHSFAFALGEIKLYFF